ncbi:MAG: class I SAM-dependent methyltransferase [Patescibacteria group bacterium]|jgi:SAM-dependent methyltransferase
MDKLTDNYQILADVYDQSMNPANYLSWRDLIIEVIDKYKIEKKTALDLACGTGNISKILNDLGFKVIGIDQSQTMLKVARHKLPTAEFIEADLRDFKIDNINSVNLATCFYDSLNYLLTDEDLIKALKNIYANLADRSIFVFDINPLEKILAAQKFTDQVYEDNDYRVVYRSGGQGLFWDIEITINKIGSGQVPIIEHHRERGYKEGEITAFLKQAGFSLLELRRQVKQGQDGKPYLNRQYFIAQKG